MGCEWHARFKMQIHPAAKVIGQEVHLLRMQVGCHRPEEVLLDKEGYDEDSLSFPVAFEGQEILVDQI